MENLNQKQGEENLKAENDFLKMKLMQEKGAIFGSGENKELPAYRENEFLNYIMEFEKQFEEHKTIKVFDAINRPTHFKTVAHIPEEQIEKAWLDLSNYLNTCGINLNVCSPNISNRELYRFATEELFEYEMDDIKITGLMHNFIYDEFYPDPVYENSNAATEECMCYILQKVPMEWAHHFRKKNLQLNEHISLTDEELIIIVNRFKQAYDDLEINEIKETECVVSEQKSWVKGIYTVTARSGKDTFPLAGTWTVFFEKEGEWDYWYICNVQIEGIKF